MPNYDAAHKARRRREQKNIDAGTAYCWRCTKHIPPGSEWDLGHDDNDPTKYMGPEHVGCNRATSTHKAMTVTDNSRDW